MELTKYQKQELGEALKSEGYEPNEFTPPTHEAVESYEFVTLTNRETSDKFAITQVSSGAFRILSSVPGTSRISDYRRSHWDEVVADFGRWAREVKLESEAVDPWEQEAEDMANDDSHFTIDELPKVDNAIDVSLDELKTQAIEHGVDQKRIKAELSEIKATLKKAARNSTKKEWMTLFKGAIISKLVDWGLETELFQGVLRALIASVHDIAQLAEHASRHLLN